MNLEGYTVGQLIGAARRKVSLGFEVRLRAFRLTFRRHMILRTLLEEGPLCQKDIAARIYADPTSLSRSVRGLLADGLVRRHVGAADRRQVVLEITPAGRGRVSGSIRMGEEYSELLTTGFRPDEVETLRSLLRRVIENAQVNPGDARQVRDE